MSSPLELIRQGILAGDWNKVCDGYKGISGSIIEPPSPNGKIEILPADINNALFDKIGRAVVSSIRNTLEGYADFVAEDDEDFDEGVEGDDDDDEEEDEDEDEDLVETVEPVAAQPEPTQLAPAPSPDPVSARARDVRNNRFAEDPTDQFRVQHGTPKREDGKQACRTEPFKPGMTNTFKDDRTLAAKDIRDSKKFGKKKKPEPRRPEVKKVKVTCCKCAKDSVVEPIFAPKSIDKSDQSNYVCNGCVGKGTR